MSASLVGSEMCIRDSKETYAAGLGPSPRAHSAPKCAAATADTTTQRPVSYTHLTLPTICSV
eukprot:2474284-Alexandrium_andersonii.AAC.1